VRAKGPCGEGKYTSTYAGHYTRQEAEKVGEGLGNFRNKPKVETKVESPPKDNVSNKPESRHNFRNDGQRPKEEAKAWTRKDREELK
jgi:hypothetical protein